MMYEYMLHNRGRLVFVALLFVCFFLRMQLGRMAGVMFLPTAEFDDMWMLISADILGHFRGENMPWYSLLLKDLGYPAFLAFFKNLGIKYVDALTCIWFFAAGAVTYMFCFVTRIKHKLVLFLIFAFVFFNPIAFDTLSGLRIYRNAILLPFYFIVISFLTVLFSRYALSNYEGDNRIILFSQMILGLIFTYTYYIKEDGIWLLLCMAVVSIICFCIVVRGCHKAGEILFHLVILVLPFAIWLGGTTAYKYLNYKHFGVWEINTRTEGELGKFVKQVYKIQSEDRTGSIWAPEDAIVKAFEASPTLEACPELKNDVLHTKWCEKDIHKHPIQGDFLGWVMLSSIYDMGTVNSIVEQEIFLRKVNEELLEAFNSGRLQKDKRLQLLPSMGGRTVKEILQLRFVVGLEYKAYITLNGFGYIQRSDQFYPDMTAGTDFGPVLQQASEVVNMDISKPNEKTGQAASLIKVLFEFYSILQPVLVFLALLGMMVWGVRHRERKIWKRRCAIMLIPVGCIIVSLGYAIGIAWFCEFLGRSVEVGIFSFYPVAFYGIGMVPFLVIFELIGTYLLYDGWHDRELGNRFLKKDTIV